MKVSFVSRKLTDALRKRSRTNPKNKMQEKNNISPSGMYGSRTESKTPGHPFIGDVHKPDGFSIKVFLGPISYIIPTVIRSGIKVHRILAVMMTFRGMCP